MSELTGPRKRERVQYKNRQRYLVAYKLRSSGMRNFSEVSATMTTGNTVSFTGMAASSLLTGGFRLFGTPGDAPSTFLA